MIDKNSLIELVNNYHGSNNIEIDFIKNKVSLDNDLNEVEHILDFMYSNKHKKLEGLSYKLMLAKTKKWDIQLQKVSIKDTEVEGVDYEVHLDFEDGFKIVKLISKQCYEREGKIMSHCVGSYFGRDSIIYSLRDSKNNPHCTIEDGNQIKGKGNGSIDPKYVDYIVKFLEKTGMTVGENEMKNIGYVNIGKLKEDLDIDFHDSTKNLLYKDMYYPTNKGIENLLDSEGNEIKNLALLDYFPMLKEEEKENQWSLKLAIDIKGLAIGFVEFMKKTKSKGVTEKDNCYTGGDYAQMIGGYSAKMSGGDYAQMSGGYSAQMSGGDYAQMSGGDYAQMSGGDYAQMIGGYSAQMSGGYSAKMSGGYSAQMSGGYSAKMSGGDYAQMSGGYSAKMSGGDYAKMSGGYSAQMSGGYSAKMSGGEHSMIMASTDSKIQGKLGSLIVIANREYNYPYAIKEYKASIIDGEILKENTWYTLKNGEFTITN